MSSKNLYFIPMKRILSFIKTSEHNYWPHLIILLLATTVDIVVIVASLQIGMAFWLIFILLGLLLILPILALLAGLIYVIADTYRLASVQQKILFPWAIIALLAPIAGIVYWEVQNNQVRYYYDLPDNNTMTVWQEYIIFEKYTSFFAPRTNYIKLPGGTDKWELTVDSAGHSAVYVNKKAHKIKAVSPKYPLVATYEDSPGQYWFYADFPAEQWKAHFSYHYDHDGISSGAVLQYTSVTKDGVSHINGSYPGIEYYDYHENEPYLEPVDSLLVYFQKQVEYYQSGSYRTKNGEYKFAFWPDSTQYSAFHQ